MSESEILGLEDKRWAAQTGKDWKTLDALLHDQLLYTHSSGVTDTKAVWMEAMKSGRVMLDHMREMSAARRSFAFETTLAARTYARWVRDLRRDGYAVHLFYFWLESADAAIRRVADRVKAGGHHVPADTIRRRYSRSVRNFLELYRPLVSTWQVYDNSNGGSRLIAFNNGYFDTIVVDARWELFLRSGDDAAGNDAADD